MLIQKVLSWQLHMLALLFNIDLMQNYDQAFKYSIGSRKESLSHITTTITACCVYGWRRKILPNLTHISTLSTRIPQGSVHSSKLPCQQNCLQHSLNIFSKFLKIYFQSKWRLKAQERIRAVGWPELQ